MIEREDDSKKMFEIRFRQPAIGVKALVSGDIDYFLAWGSTLRAAAAGVPVKVVASLASRP